MIRERHLRYLSAALIIALASYTASTAATLWRFAFDDLGVTYATVAQTYAPYVDQQPVAYLARARLIQLAPSADAAQRVEDIKDLLSLTPADGSMWIELAKAEAVAQAPPEQVVRALAMSTLTGPNEGRLMTARAAFMAPLWDYLPSESRRSWASDLRAGWSQMNTQQRSSIRDLLRRMPDEERRQLAVSLQSQGKDGAAVAKDLGFTMTLQDLRSK